MRDVVRTAHRAGWAKAAFLAGKGYQKTVPAFATLKPAESIGEDAAAQTGNAPGREACPGKTLFIAVRRSGVKVLQIDQAHDADDKTIAGKPQ